MKVTISLQKLQIRDNGDPSQETYGEVYYSFSVNEKKLAERKSTNPLKVKDNSSVTINKSVTLDIQSNNKIFLSGFVADRDKGFNGKDEKDSFAVILSASNGWKSGENNQIHLIDGRLDVILYYDVTITGRTGDGGTGSSTAPNTPRKIASMAIVSFEDSPLFKLFQNAHNNYGACFEGYDRSLLFKKRYVDNPKPSEHIREITKENILNKLTDLADDGFSIDLWIFSHGTREKICFDNNVVIDYKDIESLAKGKYANGKFPIRMVYQMNCNGSTLNNNFINIGAKVVCGSRYINFYPNQCNKFTKEWNKGERFDVAVSKSNTGSSRTAMQLLIVADAKGTSFSPKCKFPKTVLGKGKCSEAYFDKKWGLDSEYNSSKKGKENMNISSFMIIKGDVDIRKTDRPTW